MTLIERIEQDRAAARKDGDTVRRDILAYLISEARSVARAHSLTSGAAIVPTDSDVISVIRSVAAKNDEVLTHRDEPGVRQENAIIQSYLPAQMSEAELAAAIKTLIPQTGVKSLKLIGPVMATLKTQYSGRYDPATASRITKELLEG